MTDLQRSHAELREAVILANKEIRKLNFGRADNSVTVILRRVLREACGGIEGLRGAGGMTILMKMAPLTPTCGR